MKKGVIRKKVAKVVCTVFYLGYIPLFPSSSVIGSLIGGIIIFLFRNYLPMQFALIFILFLLGGFLPKELIENPGNPDPPEVIIDEVCGIMVALVGLPLKLYTILFAYFLFHLFDGIKLFPLRRLEKLPPGWGIMADDAVAGIYANLLIRLMLII